jgi:hypothetical protein
MSLIMPFEHLTLILFNRRLALHIHCLPCIFPRVTDAQFAVHPLPKHLGLLEPLVQFAAVKHDDEQVFPAFSPNTTAETGPRSGGETGFDTDVLFGFLLEQLVSVLPVDLLM